MAQFLVAGKSPPLWRTPSPSQVPEEEEEEKRMPTNAVASTFFLSLIKFAGNKPSERGLLRRSPLNLFSQPPNSKTTLTRTIPLLLLWTSVSLCDWIESREELKRRKVVFFIKPTPYGSAKFCYCEKSLSLFLPRYYNELNFVESSSSFPSFWTGEREEGGEEDKLLSQPPLRKREIVALSFCQN